jgi:hypothetical protein
VTLDKSELFYVAGHELIWLPPHGNIPSGERVKFQSEKVIPNILSSPIGLAAVGPQDWVQIQRGILCEQSVDTVV